MAETIYALASGAGRSAVAIIRVSGPASRHVLERLIGRCPEPRRAVLAAIVHPQTHELLDRGLVLWFPGPASFTGEDGAEFQVHGSRAVVAALLDAIGRVPDCRLAEAGEFTRRAFGHGKLDLAAVEGLADLIEAQTEAQRRQALHQLDGVLGRWVQDLRDDLLTALALAESAIDFADEDDVAADALAIALDTATAVAERISQELAKPRTAERIRDGFVVALAGPPNAGKSTLLNALARRDVALVSPIAGTTRDAIEIELDLGGFAVILIDTAGLHVSEDPLEQAGMERARARAKAADLVFWLQDCADSPALPAEHGFAEIWTIGTMLDRTLTPAPGHDLLIAAPSGQGLSDLTERLRQKVSQELSGGESAVLARARHRGALEAALRALRQSLGFHEAPEVVAENFRMANDALATIAGRIEVEDVLGAIFSRFCIGK
ncbi:tRNA uridine-5-carboxymethylaminomethyl(34) synthesis GTPase MnmE [Lichenifustis flavocetrariae]|uniref:tRNA modification GTPase MnmE n=1 Tax=Lichenifustis flavocetrariae TaxID=2949735 RepID=A0AA41YWJ2_9HYPH|nr:tRNA uridine-5-carboxymethylaminomethyl(34) synthesis GTPase MnmE [Lichenifustis flavocetrariae]MCW6509891.1 tRNA uridine-5-carboxymethylaminomethyl(34) synthesis GTPase MnmE [Lichenifustis flavocetrariae]